MRMDYHLHSAFSGDGRSAIGQICRSALEKGLTHIAITDHHDIVNKPFELKGFDSYLQDLAQARADYPALDLAFGLEMDYRPETWQQMKTIPAQLSMDFALLSLHFIDGVDPYLPEYFEHRTQREGYCLYLNRLAEMIDATEGPWVLAHITYVAKFARFPDPALRYGDYADALDAVLKRVVQKGYGLEVNASGIKNGAGLLPGADVLRRYRELGGEIVATGSDAHAAEDVGRWITEASDAVRAAGFRYLAAYRQLKPEFIKID